MGKVFTWDEIQRGHVPKLLSFPIVSSSIRDRLNACHGVIGAILYGSSLWGEETIRSDVDCFVLYRSESHSQVVSAARQLHHDAATFYVPVEFQLLDERVARTSMHRVGISARHVLEQAVGSDGMIKKDPLPHINFASSGVTHEVQNYLAHKASSLEKGLAWLNVERSPREFLFLQKALEAPVHVARQMLLWRGIYAGDSKWEVVRRYAEIASEDLAYRLDQLLEADARYTTSLSRLVAKPDADSYMHCMRQVEEAAWWSLEFVKANIVFLHSAS